jgi:tetratricopeptide (TPR) repeat protein
MTLKKLLSYLVLAVLFILPLFSFPWVRSFVYQGKNIFLWFSVLLGLLIWAASLVTEKKSKVVVSSVDGILALFSILGLFSLFFVSSGVRVRALTQPGALGTLIGLLLFSFLFSQTELKKNPRKVVSVLTISLGLSILISVVLFLLPASRYPLQIANLLTITNSRWSTLGSVFELILFSLPLLAYWVFRLVKGKESVKAAIFTVVLLIGLGISGYQISKTKPILLDYSSSWAIAVEAFKQKPLIGVGSANFNTAFSLYRPVEFNQSENWALRFDQSGSFLLHLWTEMGTLGLGLWLVVLYSCWKLAKKDRKYLYSFLAIIGFQIFLPVNISLLFLYFVFLALIKPTKQIYFPDWIWVSRTVGAIAFVFVVAIGYFLTRFISGEVTFINSLKAVSEGKGTEAYQLQSKAIGINRYLVDYRISRSQTDLALANAVSAQQDLTDEDKQQVSLLIQESINEAKSAAALEPRNVYPWENLAQIYRQIINLAEGADQWTISAYQQAVALDPVNPELRVALGGVYYGLGNYVQAGRIFENAVQLKTDLANGWYNWAWALKQQNQLFDAVQAMQQAVSLVDPSSADYEKALADFEEWRKELGEAVKDQQAQQQEAPAQLTEPEAIPAPDQEPIELSPDAAPEIEPEPQSTPLSD